MFNSFVRLESIWIVDEEEDDDDFSQDVHGFSPMFGIFLREFSEVLIFSR